MNKKEILEKLNYELDNYENRLKEDAIPWIISRLKENNCYSYNKNVLKNTLKSGHFSDDESNTIIEFLEEKGYKFATEEEVKEVEIKFDIWELAIGGLITISLLGGLFYFINMIF